jgi:sugar lactone lactonase YvrE
MPLRSHTPRAPRACRTFRSLRSVFLAPLFLPALLAACGGETPPPAGPPAPPASAAASAAAPAASSAPALSASGASAAPAEPPKAAAPAPAVKYTGFATPESVLYDPDGDRYLVSNINGKPFEADNNGFISVLSPEGKVTDLKWIDGGGKGKVKLDAPKGMAIVKGVLYVADITVVRMFDSKTGAPEGEVKIEKATFLNDVAAGADGKVYVSDSGLKGGDKGFEPTGTDAVYVIEKGKAKAIAKSPDLGRPNGLLPTDKGVIVVTFGSGEVYRLDDKGAKKDVSKPPKGSLDGVIALGDSLLVSSWEGSAIYKGKLGGSFEVVLSDQSAPADIGYDTKRGRLLVPHFLESTVEAYDLK